MDIFFAQDIPAREWWVVSREWCIRICSVFDSRLTTHASRCYL